MQNNWNKKPVAKLLLTWYINLADTDEPLKNKAGSEAEKLIFKKRLTSKNGYVIMEFRPRENGRYKQVTYT
ncbi:hypothetical protein, partial [Paenibacillus chitinolyticus]